MSLVKEIIAENDRWVDALVIFFSARLMSLNGSVFELGMHRILFLPDTGYPAGYPVKAGYRISGQNPIKGTSTESS
jgi:hypothetical protein